MPHDAGDAEPFVVSAFYLFARIESPEALRKTLLRLVGRFNILGTMLSPQKALMAPLQALGAKRISYLTPFEKIRVCGICKPKNPSVLRHRFCAQR